VHENKQLADKFHKLSSDIQALLVKEAPENTNDLLGHLKKEFLAYEDSINDIIPEWIKTEFSQKYPRASLPIKLGGYSTIRLPERHNIQIQSRHRTLSIQEVFPPPIIVIPPSPTPEDK
jgi:hypothetical protein